MLFDGARVKPRKGRISSETNQHDGDRETGNGRRGCKITTIDLKTEAEVPGIDEAKFREQAELTKKTCPVSVALAGTQINLDAKLV